MYRDKDLESPAAMLGRAVGERLSLPCHIVDPDLWFADKQTDLDAAKQLCVGCPIRPDCLAAALARSEPWGVWGGELVMNGSVIPYKPPRGRPRKAHPQPVAA